MTTEIATTKKSVLVSMASRYGMDHGKFMNVIKKTLIPKGASDEQIAAFLVVADRYDLDPFVKQLHAFPSKDGGIVPVIGVDGAVHFANRHEQFDGMDFDYDDGKSVTCRIHRKDRTHPCEVTEFMAECKRNTAPWNTHPQRMLRHKAVIQAVRYAFSLTGVYDEDEAREMTVNVVEPMETKPAIEAQPEPEWPKPQNGGWIDSRGVLFHPDFHAMSGVVPSVTAQGHFRKRRGCDQTAFATYERQQLNPTPEPTGPDYDEVMRQLQSATSVEALDLAEDLARGFSATPEQRNELEATAQLVRQALAEQMEASV